MGILSTIFNLNHYHLLFGGSYAIRKYFYIFHRYSNFITDLLLLMFFFFLNENYWKLTRILRPQNNLPNNEWTRNKMFSDKTRWVLILLTASAYGIIFDQLEEIFPCSNSDWFTCVTWIDITKLLLVHTQP